VRAANRTAPPGRDVSEIGRTETKQCAGRDLVDLRGQISRPARPGRSGSVRSGRRIGQQARQHRRQRPVPTCPVHPPGVGDGAAELGQVGGISAIQLTQKIINAGEHVTDSAYPRLILTGGRGRPGGAQQLSDLGRRREVVLSVGSGFAQRPDALTDHRLSHPPSVP
jgi:hypothetical protein